MSWSPTDVNKKYGVVTYNFNGSFVNHGLTLRIGDLVHILEEYQGWYRGFTLANKSVKGIFPQSHIFLKECEVENPGMYETVIPTVEPVVQEVTNVLREWGILWKKLYQDRNEQMFMALKSVMIELMEHRRNIISKNITQEQQAEQRNKIVQKIDWGNSKLGLDLVPRIDGEIVNVDHLSVFELYKVHMQGQENSSNASMKGTLRRTTPEISKATSHHLFLSMRSLMCNVGDEAAVSFSLYDSKTCEYISEKFVVRYTKYGIPKDPEKLSKMFAIFTDLRSSDLLRDIYIVCKIIRKGRLLLDSKKNPSSIVRRPYGCGVFFVGDLLRGKADVDDDEELETNIQIVCPSNEDDFHDLEDYIIKKHTAKYNASGSSPSAVCISLRVFHGELEKVMKENPLVFNTEVIETKRIGFPEVIMPGDFRNDVYLQIGKADFERGSKTSQKNIEIIMQVFTVDGNVVPDSILLGTGEAAISEFHSFVIYHCNNPVWQENLKLQIPLEVISNCHLRFTFSHCSRNEGKTKTDKVIGFSFLKLLDEDGTVVKDGTHELFIYKLDYSISFNDVQSYLSLPTSVVDLEKQKLSGVVYAGPSRNQKESFCVDTKLCSTKFSQNHELVGLLKWRLHPDGIKNILKSVLNVGAEELVRFLQDIFDALFNILSEKGDLVSMNVFTVLVHILCVVEDEKYEKFKSTVNTYIDEHFSGTQSYRSLIGSLKHLLKDLSADGNNGTTLRNALQSLPFLYKFIIKSKELQSRATGNGSESDLKSLLEDVFATLCEMLSSKASTLVSAKEIALEKLPAIINDSLKVFTHDEFCVIFCNIVNCLPKKASHLQTVKLSCIRMVVSGELFKNEGAKSILFPLVVEHLVFHLERRQEHSICLEILGDLISSIKSEERGAAELEVEQLANSLLTILLNVFLTIDRRGPLTGATVACMVGILKLMSEKHFEQFLERFNEKGDLKDFLTKILVAFKELMSQDFFPRDWFVLRLLCNNLVLTAVQHLCRAFTDHFLKGDDFDHQLWSNFFQLAIMFITQPSLQLECFLSNKRENILDRYGDMRQIMGFEVVDMWENLEDNKIHFIPQVIGAFLEITLIPEPELRKATIPVFFDMMKVEFAQKGNFRMVEKELIDRLDVLVSQNKGDEEYEKLFKELMGEHVSACFDPALREQGIASVEAVSQLLRRLLDYRAVMASYDCGLDQTMMCMVRLLKFYKGIGREDMYLRYVYKLCDLHLKISNFTEAGCTLLLHADLLEWTDKIFPKLMKFPEQTEWERKEQLYSEIINYFDKGKTWENGIRLCKELSYHYEQALIDYIKLSKILRTQAQFYDNIMIELRPEPEYFRVAFYGHGFPYYLKDHEFIYRGLEYEKLANFTQRLRTEFPNAQVLTKNSPPDKNIVNSAGQYIQVCSVQPIATGLTMFEKKPINDKVKGYYKVNDVYTFTFSRPFHRGSKAESEFSTLWLEKTTCQTREQFPGILRWSKIESIEKVELNPLQNAIESIFAKNKELAEMIFKFDKQPETNINPLSMILNGIIDANVNGGIANYQKAFLSEEYEFLHPEEAANIVWLKDLLKEQVYLLGAGLEVHDRLATLSIRGLHDKMVVMFDGLRQSVETGRPVEDFMATLPEITSRMDGTSTLPAQGSSPKPRRLGVSSTDPVKGHVSMPQLPRAFSFATITKKVNSAISLSSPSLMRQSVLPVEGATGSSPSSSAGSSPTLRRKKEQKGSPNDATPAPPLPPRKSVVLSSADTRRASTQSLGVASCFNSAPGLLSGSLPSLSNISEDSEELPPALPRKTKADKWRSVSTAGLSSVVANNSCDPATTVTSNTRRSSDFSLDGRSSSGPQPIRLRNSDSNLMNISRNEDRSGGNVAAVPWKSQLTPGTSPSAGMDHSHTPSSTTSGRSSVFDRSSMVFNFDKETVMGTTGYNNDITGPRSRMVPPQSTSPLNETENFQTHRVVPAQSTTPLGSLSPRSDSSSLASPRYSPGTENEERTSSVYEVADFKRPSTTNSESTTATEQSCGLDDRRGASTSAGHQQANSLLPPPLPERKPGGDSLQASGAKLVGSDSDLVATSESGESEKRTRPTSLPIDSNTSGNLLSSDFKTEFTRSERDVRVCRPPKPRPRTTVIHRDLGNFDSGPSQGNGASRGIPLGKPPPVPPKRPGRITHNSSP